jgi:hypothetical protein
MGEILMGEGAHCNVRIPVDHYPLIAGREIKIWLGNNGWQISDSLSHPIIVDSKPSFQASTLRSGSIFRLSPRGPDFQFVVQGQHDATWQDIAVELELLKSESNVPERLLKKSKSAKQPVGAVPPARPQPPTSAAPARPQPAVPTKSHSAPSAAPPAPRAASPAPPSAPPRPTGAAPGAPSPPATEPPAKVPMDKNKRNNLILFISLPIIAILIIFFMPRSKPPESKEEDKTEEVTKTENDDSNDETSDSDKPTSTVEGEQDGSQSGDPTNTDRSSSNSDDAKTESGTEIESVPD